MGGYEICPDSYEILSGFCSFHEVRKAGMLRVSQGQYKERKGTGSREKRKEKMGMERMREFTP